MFISCSFLSSGASCVASTDQEWSSHLSNGEVFRPNDCSCGIQVAKCQRTTVIMEPMQSFL